jgi:hypothetical protein
LIGVVSHVRPIQPSSTSPGPSAFGRKMAIARFLANCGGTTLVIESLSADGRREVNYPGGRMVHRLGGTRGNRLRWRRLRYRRRRLPLQEIRSEGELGVRPLAKTVPAATATFPVFGRWSVTTPATEDCSVVCESSRQRPLDRGDCLSFDYEMTRRRSLDGQGGSVPLLPWAQQPGS